MGQRIGFKYDFYTRRHSDTISIRKSQQLIFIQQRIEVFGPPRINATIQNHSFLISAGGGSPSDVPRMAAAWRDMAPRNFQDFHRKSRGILELKKTESTEITRLLDIPEKNPGFLWGFRKSRDDQDSDIPRECGFFWMSGNRIFSRGRPLPACLLHVVSFKHPRPFFCNIYLAALAATYSKKMLN